MNSQARTCTRERRHRCGGKATTATGRVGLALPSPKQSSCCERLTCSTSCCRRTSCRRCRSRCQSRCRCRCPHHPHHPAMNKMRRGAAGRHDQSAPPMPTYSPGVLPAAVVLWCPGCAPVLSYQDCQLLLWYVRWCVVLHGSMCTVLPKCSQSMQASVAAQAQQVEELRLICVVCICVLCATVIAVQGGGTILTPRAYSTRQSEAGCSPHCRSHRRHCRRSHRRCHHHPTVKTILDT